MVKMPQGTLPMLPREWGLQIIEQSREHFDLMQVKGAGPRLLQKHGVAILQVVRR